MRKLKCLILFIELIGTIGVGVGVDLGPINIDLDLLFPPSDEPLILTKYINAGQIELAKNVSRVDSTNMLGVTSYTGYFTVNELFNSNLFFWFFPAKQNPSTAPTLLWLQGGPGGSSLYGLFAENGPFFIDSTNNLALRQYSWHNAHNLVYIDSPVGTGFSFTDLLLDHAIDEMDVGEDLFQAVRQFYMLFPELRPNGFYVAGESYAGKYIPALGNAILEHSVSTDINDRINLQGLGIGNGLTDPINQIGYGKFLHQLSFIDENGRDTFEQLQNAAIACLELENYVCALAFMSQIINVETSQFNVQTGFTSSYNYLIPDGYDPYINAVTEYMQTSGIETYLHVGNRNFQPFTDLNIVQVFLVNDIMGSVAHLVSKLLPHYKILVYNGQLDVIVADVLTENYISKLDFNAAAEYKVAKRNIWRVDGEIAGYVKQAGNLTRVTVRKAGHMAPVDQPKWVWEMLLTLTYGNQFSLDLH